MTPRWWARLGCAVCRKIFVEMFRITGGSAKGRRLQVLKQEDLRPTSDKVRQAIFNLLRHSVLPPAELDKMRALDLFAGAGSLGLEAISRGVSHCVFVEQSRRAVAQIKASVAQLSFQDQTTIRCERVERFLKKQTPHPPSPLHEGYGLIFADPPYRLRADAMLFEGLAQKSQSLIDGALLVFESPSRERPSPAVGWSLELERSYGDTTLSFFRWSATLADGADSELTST